MPIWCARAPVRFCDLGGCTDTRSVERGYVLNMAATLYTHVTLQVGAGERVLLRSEDTGEEVESLTIDALAYDGILDLVKAAMRRSGVSEAANVIVRSD